MISESVGIPLGTLDGTLPAWVDATGSINHPNGLRWSWCVVGEDRLHDPLVAASVRQRSDGAVIETAMRVLGGDVVVRAYATPGSVVVEFDNATEAACAVAVIVDGDGDGDSIVSTRSAAEKFAGPDRASVLSALARRDVTTKLRSGQGSTTALVWTLAHRTTLRTAVGSPSGLDVHPDEVRRGWRRRLASGMQVTVDDRVLDDAIDQARIATLACAGYDDVDVMRALEDWGFDAEAARAWERLDRRARRRLRRDRFPAVWDELVAAQGAVPGPRLLNAVRGLLVRDDRRHVELFPTYPRSWLGLGVAVHDLPLRAGSLGFALRWHGARPALLWEARGDFELTCPVLAPGWSTRELHGEMLFPSPDPALVPVPSPNPTSNEAGGSIRPGVGFD